MASASAPTNIDAATFDLNAYMPLDAAHLLTNQTLSQAIANKAASVYAFHRDHTHSGKKPKAKACDDCRSRRCACVHNAPIINGTKEEVIAAAKDAFEFFINEHANGTADIVGPAKAYLQKLQNDGQADELVVELVLGIVGVIQVYQAASHPDMRVPATQTFYASFKKGTAKVKATVNTFAREIEVEVFGKLVASLDGEGPDGTEGDEVGEEATEGAGADDVVDDREISI